MKRGSAKKDLQEETKKVKQSNGSHSIIIFLKDEFIKFQNYKIKTLIEDSGVFRFFESEN